MAKHPSAFISYSWDDDDHKAWVLELATRLRADGVDVFLDKWEAVPGDRLPQLMEKAVSDNEFVLIICTPKYREKSNERTGGVGYEGDVITAEILEKGDHRKFIPIIRGDERTESEPTWIKGKLSIDLRGDPYSEMQYKDLLDTLHRTRPAAPPVGKRSSTPTIGKPSSSPPKSSRVKSVPGIYVPPNSSDPIKILGVNKEEVTAPRMDGSRGCALYAVPIQLSRIPSQEWSTAFIENWDSPPRFTTSHRPGIASVNVDHIILDGTTLEEVRDVHQETLKLCVDEANKVISKLEAERQRNNEIKANREEQHRENVEHIADQIDFK